MTRDLPFDGTDDTEVDDAGSDMAYRVATGVARVARAGAYVTGGALVASNTGTPARPGDARLDSLHTGWAHTDPDPDPDVPSPVVTFPDPEPTWAPPGPLHSQQPAPLEHAPSTPGWMEPDSRASWDSSDQTTSWYFTEETPDDDPSAPGWVDGSTQSSQAESGPMDWLDSPDHALPGHSPFALPGTQAFSGPDPFGLRVPAAGEAEDATAHTPDHGSGNGFGPSAELDGDSWDSLFGNGGLFGDNDSGSDSDFGIFFGVESSAKLDGEFTVEFGLNEQDGLYLHTEAWLEASAEVSVQAAVGNNVGDQLDQFSDWIDSKPSAGTGSARATNDQAGSANSGLGTGGTPGSTTAPAAAPVAPALAAPAPIAHVAPAPVAAPAPAPVAPAAPAPVAPATVAPVPVAPAVAAPVVVQPVAATPLQTTIQPEAASTPIANVLTGPSGASPLTAPAAVAPALFDPPKPVPATNLDPRHPDIGHTGTSPVSKVPTTITNSVPVPATGNPLDPTTGKLPDLGGITNTPGVTLPVPTIDLDGTPSKIPGATVNPSLPGTKPAPTIDPDGTRPSVPTTQQPVPTPPKTVDPTHTRPTVEVPSTVDVPTVSLPTQQPTMTHSITVPTADIAPPPVHIPTQAPVTPIKPPVTLNPNPKPISDTVDYQAAQYTPPGDHLLFASGLSSGLMPHQDSPLSQHDGTDVTLV